MIIRVQRAGGEIVYRPLMLDPELDAWVPLSEATYATPLEAAEACHEALSKSWRAIVLSARKLRALSEHPRLQEFEADGISGELISDEAQTLTRLMERRWTEFVHLLDEPLETDLVLLAREQDEPESGSQDEPESGSQDEPESGSEKPRETLKHAVQDLIGSLANFRSSTRKVRTDTQTLLDRLREEEQSGEASPARDEGSSDKEGDQ